MLEQADLAIMGGRPARRVRKTYEELAIQIHREALLPLLQADRRPVVPEADVEQLDRTLTLVRQLHEFPQHGLFYCPAIRDGRGEPRAVAFQAQDNLAFRTFAALHVSDFPPWRFEVAPEWPQIDLQFRSSPEIHGAARAFVRPHAHSQAVVGFHEKREVRRPQSDAAILFDDPAVNRRIATAGSRRREYHRGSQEHRQEHRLIMVMVMVMEKPLSEPVAGAADHLRSRPDYVHLDTACLFRCQTLDFVCIERVRVQSDFADLAREVVHSPT